jgi:4-coumarate--CoA ligase
VKKDPTLKGNDVVDWISERVAPYKKLRGGVLFVDAIPKSPSGKILRRELKEKALQEIKAKL